MIYIDESYLPVDQTMDGGDSTVRGGIMMMCNYRNELGLGMLAWFPKPFKGWFTRHCFKAPWDNPKNFSRDQMLPYIAGLHRIDEHIWVKMFFYERLKQFFFAQNFERDYPGTTKYPWPHKVDGKWRLFDFADPLLPNHIGAIILAGKIKWAYPFLLLAYPWHLLGLIIHRFSKHHEENQAISESYIYGTLPIYRRIHPRWKEVSKAYWQRRNEIEYHDMLVKLVEGI
jgi:hypothetical protein